MKLESSWIERFYTHFLGRDFAYLFAGGLFICIAQYAWYSKVVFLPQHINLELIGFLSASYFLGLIITDLGRNIVPFLNDSIPEHFQSYLIFSQKLADNCNWIVNLYERNTYFLIATSSVGFSSLFGGFLMLLVSLIRQYEKNSNNYYILTISFIVFGIISLWSAYEEARYIERERKALENFISEMYLFRWEEVPGDDSGRLLEFLKQEFDIRWAEAAKIEKIDNDRNIKVTAEKNHLSLGLNNEKNKVNLKIDDGRSAEFRAKSENGKLNIYREKLNIYSEINQKKELPKANGSQAICIFILFSLFIINIGIIIKAFSMGEDFAFKSIAGFIIPFIAIHLINFYHKDFFYILADIPFWISFPSSFFLGCAMISLISSIASLSVLILGLIFSTIFFILVYSSGHIFEYRLKDKGLIPIYFGIAVGFFVYIFLYF